MGCAVLCDEAEVVWVNGHGDSDQDGACNSAGEDYIHGADDAQDCISWACH